MKYVFNERVGKGFVIISADDLMLHAKDSRYAQDDMDCLGECREAQRTLHERGIKAMKRYIKRMQPLHSESILEDYKERMESFQNFNQLYSGNSGDEIRILYCQLELAPKVSMD